MTARWLRLCLLLLCSLAILPVAVRAESLEEIFRAANDSFAHGQYTEAAQHYQRLIEAGIRDADVYMNLGLSHARAGELGRAVLAFEQSLHYRPGDSDATNALAQARAAIGKRSAERQGEALVETRPPLSEAIVRPFSEDSLAYGLLFCDAVLFLSLILRRRARSETTRTGLAVAASLSGLALICVLSGLLIKRGTFRDGEAAIILRDGAELREAPDPRATMRARASEGGTARVLARDEGYARVRTSSGAVGWMSDADVALIVD
jgi:tetratricopeptide (TPR) repeat protein